jgi:hypothetical protein
VEEAGARELLVFIYMLKRELKKVKMGEILRDEPVNSMTCTSIVSLQLSETFPASTTLNTPLHVSLSFQKSTRKRNTALSYYKLKLTLTGQIGHGSLGRARMTSNTETVGSNHSRTTTWKYTHVRTRFCVNEVQNLDKYSFRFHITK